jgi:hypothetical protein
VVYSVPLDVQIYTLFLLLLYKGCTADTDLY